MCASIPLSFLDFQKWWNVEMLQTGMIKSSRFQETRLNRKWLCSTSLTRNTSSFPVHMNIIKTLLQIRLYGHSLREKTADYQELCGFRGYWSVLIKWICWKIICDSTQRSFSKNKKLCSVQNFLYTLFLPLESHAAWRLFFQKVGHSVVSTTGSRPWETVTGSGLHNVSSTSSVLRPPMA